MTAGTRKTVLIGAAAALLAAASLAAWRLKTPVVSAHLVQPAPLVQTLQFSARVASASRVELGATVTGRVLQVLVDEGAQVRAGQPLVQLEDAEWQAALAQARAAEQQAAARLSGLRSTGRMGVQAGMAQAQSVLKSAQADLLRTQDLVSRGFLSEARLEDSQRAVAVAQAQLDVARAQGAANADAGTDSAQAQSQLAQARAATQAATARLAQAVLVAPSDGRVLTRSVQPGQIVQPGRALLRLVLAGPTQLLAPVDERYLQQLRPGQAASVRADAFPEQRFAAQVLQLAPLVDAQRGSVEVKLAVAQPPVFLREDMTLSVEVQTARREQALAVPLAALRDGNNNRSSSSDNQGQVWLAIDGHVQSRAVQLGLRSVERVEVLQGLAAGDVVLLGAAPEPGRRVRADTAAAPATSAAPSTSDAGSAMTNAIGR